MIFKYLYIFLLLLFFGPALLLAQNDGEFTINEECSYQFTYNSIDDTSINNFFIKEIARLNFLNLKQTTYEFAFNLAIDFRINSENQMFVKSHILPVELTGDVFYKDFNLSTVMLPTNYSFDLIITSANNQTVTSSGNETVPIAKEVLTVSEKNEYSATAKHPLQNVILGFDVSNLKCSYQEEDKTAFNERISEIHDYLALKQLSLFQLDKAEKIDPENLATLLSSYLMIYDLERYLSIVNTELASIPFVIPDEHQAFLQSNLKKLESHKRRLNTLFHQSLSSTNPIIDEQVLDAATEVLLLMQLAYIDELSKQSFFYEPVYQYLAGYFHDDGSFAMFLEKLNRYFNFSGTIESSSMTVEEAFSHILVEKYLLLSDSLIAQEKFQTAEILLKSAAIVSRSHPYADCDVVVFNKLSTIKWGIYDAYIRVAQTAMEAGNLEMGFNYLDIAKGYQKENENLIITTGYTLIEYEKLAWNYFQQGDEYITSERIEDALTSYTAARKIYRMLDNLKYDEVISKKITNTERLIDELPEESD